MASEPEGKGKIPTPSPLRRLEDPSRYHIMPSSRKDKKTAMAPPPPRPKSKGINALDEDTFVEAIGEIIERDFFPDLPKLHRQIKWLEGLEARGRPSATEVRRVVHPEQRRFGEEGGGGGGGATPGGLTPLHPGSTPLMGGGAFGTGMQRAAMHAEEEEERGALVPPEVTLDQFMAKFQSEDDASFEDLAVKMREAHRRKYWWVYEHPMIESGKEALYLLQNGEMMSEEDRKKRDEAVNSKPRRGDDRPNVPDTWTYRIKNHLLFQPELEQTRKVHKLDGEQTLLLTDGSSVPLPTNNTLSTSHNPRVGEAAKAPKVLVHRNTRFVPLSDGAGGTIAPSPIERLRSDLTTLSTDTTASAEARGANDGFVPMTPAIIPGAGGQSPFITWGEIEGTPLRVAEPFERSTTTAHGFKMQNPSYREKLASNLESSTRKKGSATPKVYSEKRDASGRKGSVTPLSMQRRASSLTPAAQSLAQKLASSAAKKGGGDVFGGQVSSELRASYTRGASGAAGAKRGATPSPLVGSSKRSKGSEPSGANKGTSLTDNLLDI